MDVLIYPSRVAAITAPSSTAVDDHLRGKVDLREALLPHDRQSVTEGRCWAHGPARTTICGGEGGSSSKIIL